MAPRKGVPSLQDLCLQTIQSHVTKLILNYAKNNQQQVPFEDSDLNAAIETYVYNNLPLNTHDRFVELRLLQLEKIFFLESMYSYLSELLRDELGYRVEYLEEVLLSDNVRQILEPIATSHRRHLKSTDHKETIKKVALFKYLMSPVREILKLIVTSHRRHPKSTGHEETIKEVALFKYLMSPVSRLKVRTISMGDRLSSRYRAMSVFRHPEESVVDLVLVILLKQMTRLEIFSGHQTRFYSVIGWRSKLAHNIKALKSLTSFTLQACSDEILAAVCENCKSICDIDVSSARHVTDNCIQHLTQCPSLQSVTLDGTGVSGRGYYRLLTETTSTDLRYVSGLHNHVNEILDQMESSRVPFRPSQLRQLCYSGVEPNHLNLISTYFPHLTQLSLEFKTIADPDSFNFSSVFRLRSLEHVGLQFSCEDFEKVRRVISRCPRVTSLTLQQGSEPNAVHLTSSLLGTIALCPNLEKLTIKQSKMNGAYFDPRVELVVNPFLSLKELVWLNSMTIPFAQYILCHTVNIESFEFTSNPPYEWPRIADRFFECILEHNPLTELKYLSLRYGHNLSTEMLKRIISKCEKLKFLRINVSHPEKEALLTFIAENNYDLVSHIDSDCAWFR